MLIRNKERYALVIPANSSAEQVAQDIVMRWMAGSTGPRYHAKSGKYYGMSLPTIIPPPAGLTLALKDFCLQGACMVVDTMGPRPVLTVWTKESGVPLPAPPPPRLTHGT